MLEVEVTIDDTKTAELWKHLEPRYIATFIVDEIHGYKNVPVTLYKPKMANDEISRLVVLMPGKTIEDIRDSNLLSAIWQTFSKAEVIELHKYTKQFKEARLKLRRAEPITDEAVGVGDCFDDMIGVEYYYHDFDETRAPFSLPFNIWGYYEVSTTPERHEPDDVLHAKGEDLISYASTIDSLHETLRENQNN